MPLLSNPGDCGFGTGSGSDQVLIKATSNRATRSLPLPVPKPDLTKENYHEHLTGLSGNPALPVL
jgi:hypothetical protein